MEIETMKNKEKIDNEKRAFKIKREAYIPSPTFPLGPITRPVGNLFYDEYLRMLEEAKKIEEK